MIYHTSVRMRCTIMGNSSAIKLAELSSISRSCVPQMPFVEWAFVIRVPVLMVQWLRASQQQLTDASVFAFLLCVRAH